MSRVEMKILQRLVSHFLLGIQTYRKLLAASAKEDNKIGWEVNKALLREYNELYTFSINLRKNKEKINEQ